MGKDINHLNVVFTYHWPRYFYSKSSGWVGAGQIIMLPEKIVSFTFSEKPIDVYVDILLRSMGPLSEKDMVIYLWL